LSAGTIIKLTNVNLGFRLTLPQTMSRDWDYETAISDPDQVNTSTGSGVDKLKLPASYSLGLSFIPADAFTIAIDLDLPLRGDVLLCDIGIHVVLREHLLATVDIHHTWDGQRSGDRSHYRKSQQYK